MTKIDADTDERARGAQVEGIIEDWIAANPSLVGELEIQIVRDLSDRISAALVEKDAEIKRLQQLADDRRIGWDDANNCANRSIAELRAALVEKEHEVWDKAAEIAERHNEGHNYDYRNCGLAIATAIREAARTSEKGTHEPTS